MSCRAASRGERIDDLAPAGVADDLALGRDPAAQRVEELVCAVPLEPATPTSSPAWTSRSIGAAAGRSRSPRALSTTSPRRSPIGSSRPRALLGELVGAGHQAHQLARRPLAALERRDRLARAHHGDAVADLVISSMRWVMKITPTPAARPPTIANRRSRVATSSAEVASSRIRIRGSRSSARTMPQAWRSRQRELLDGDAAVDGATEQLLEHRPRAGALLARRHARAPGVVGAEPDVVEHRARLGDEHLLEHRDDAAACATRGVRTPARLAVEPDLAGVRRVDAAQDSNT